MKKFTQLKTDQSGIAHLGILILVAAVIALVGYVGYDIYQNNYSAASTKRRATTTSTTVTQPAAETGITYQNFSANGVSGVKAYDGSGWLATFTNGARTVTIRGNARTFAEPTSTTATVTHNVWVRVLSKPFSGQPDTTWLQARKTDTSPDILTYAVQYIDRAPTLRNGSGLKYAGDASYGPLQSDGTRKEGSDYNDYLGLTINYGTTVDRPEADEIGSLDCSGYIRMVWGYRGSVPLSGSTGSTNLLARRSYQMYDLSPGIISIPRGAPKDLTKLSPGDLMFFDARTDDGTAIDHVAMFLGRDNSGHYRFLSSRKTVNGPTMGDVGGLSIADGTNLYGRSFVAARRL